MGGRLLRQLIVPLTVVFLVVAVLATGHTYWQERRTLLRELDHRITDAGALVQEAFNLANDRPAAREPVAATNPLHSPHHRTLITDAGGKLVSGPQSAGDDEALVTSFAGATPERPVSVTVGGCTWRVGAFSLGHQDSGGAWTGTLYYAESQERLQATLRETLLVHIGSGVAMLVLLAGGVYFVLNRRVLGPLQALEYHYRTAEIGRIEEWKSVPASDNEIERLHHHFNHLMLQMRTPAAAASSTAANGTKTQPLK